MEKEKKVKTIILYQKIQIYLIVGIIEKNNKMHLRNMREKFY